MAADASRAPISDPWSVLDYKDFGGPRAAWLSQSDSRRLAAYMVYAAYAENRAAQFGDITTDRREYGDAGLLVEQALAHLLGESQTIEVDGASDVGEDGEPTDAEAAAALTWLQDWADAESFQLRLIDAERKAVGLGDAVYVVEFDREKGRPRVGVMDPGLYFPVLPLDARADDYPERVHFAWEEETDDRGRMTRVLRRITYELMDADQPYRVPWSEEPLTKVVLLTDTRFGLQAVGGTTRDGVALDRLSGGVAVQDPSVLPIDFLPIVHVPNTIPGADHYGQPILAKVMHVLDDLQGADTDTQAAQATTGSPMILTKGLQGNADIEVGPGKAVNVDADGDAKVLDTSPNLEAMGKHVDRLQERLTQNARIPDVALGKVRSSAEAGMSGVALALRFGPLESLVRQMRQGRAGKYRLLLRFVQRIGMALDDGPPVVAEARLTFGSFLPNDVAGTMKSVAEGLAAGIISLETAVLMLTTVGLPIEDAAEEVERIVRRNYRAAAELVDATGDIPAARRLLGLDPAVPASTAVPTAADPAAPVAEVVEPPGQ